jgi:hypothetical protein
VLAELTGTKNRHSEPASMAGFLLVDGRTPRLARACRDFRRTPRIVELDSVRFPHSLGPCVLRSLGKLARHLRRCGMRALLIAAAVTGVVFSAVQVGFSQAKPAATPSIQERGRSRR